MHDMTEFFYSHQAIDVNGLRPTDAIDVIPSEIDQHHMLGTILD
jgi:hypothetical protein